MAWLSPASLRLVKPEWAAEVSSPPHDALSPEGRRRHLASHPRSFLAVTRGPDDQADQELSGRELLTSGRQALDTMIDDGLFSDPAEPAVYLYRLEVGDHAQTAVVANLAVEAYDQGHLRIHEEVRSDRAAHLADHLQIVGVQSSPIAVGFRDLPEVESAIDRIMQTTPPLVSFRSHDGLEQQIYAVDEDEGSFILAALDQRPIYLIDGHHRAAASSLHQARQTAVAAADGLPARGHILAALFPVGQLRNLAFHRVVHSVDQAQADQIDQELAARFSLRRTTDPVEVANRRPTEIAMARAGDPTTEPQWTLIDVPLVGDDNGEAGSLQDLDSVRLSTAVLGPVLGIDESQDGDRLRYVAGADDVAAVAALRPEPNELMFLTRPVPMSTLLAIADRRQVLPPKSTYFDPKVRSGIFIRHL